MSIKFISAAQLPTPWGAFIIHGFTDTTSEKEHIALSYGNITQNKPILTRIHSECLTGDALFSMRCDCGAQLEMAMQHIADEGTGIILYLRQEGRGIGLINKIKAYHLQDIGADTVEANEKLGFAADMRDYTMCLPMLQHLRVKQLKLMTNNPRKVTALKKLGIDVVERLSLQTEKNPHNEKYLATKAGKLGHYIDDQ